MIRLEIMNHRLSLCYGTEMAFNPSTILVVRDGRENLAGTHYVEVLFAKDVRDGLPINSDGFAAVKGHYNDVLKIIERGADDGRVGAQGWLY